MDGTQRRPPGPTGTPTILSHLLTLPSQTLIRLFSYPSNALAIFRLLPSLSRHLILTLLFLPDPPKMASGDVATIFSREGTIEEEGAQLKKSRSARGITAGKDVLSRLGIIRETNGTVFLNGKWTDSLRRALIGGGNHQSFGVPSLTPPNQRLSPAQLDEFALRSWESILLYMVAAEDVRVPSRPVLYLLQSAGLMQSGMAIAGAEDGWGRSRRAGDLEDLTITSKGFQFLLDDVPSQLWMLLHAYLITLSESASAQANSTSDIVEHLTFLFTLGSATLGQDYETSSLTSSQREMMNFFSDLGLVYRQRAQGTHFYPTRLVTTLTNAGQLPLLGSDQNGEEEKGFVILETNYKVYAYTNNQLRINILHLFVHVRSRFPNLVTGVITRDSVKEALRKGISAEQIIMYLTHHAHPQMYKNNPLLPVTVTDQIRLWEREKNRVQPEEGGMFREFSSGADFSLVQEYAEQMGVLLWSDVNTRKLFVAASGIQPLYDFINRRLAHGGR